LRWLIRTATAFRVDERGESETSPGLQLANLVVIVATVLGFILYHVFHR